MNKIIIHILTTTTVAFASFLTSFTSILVIDNTLFSEIPVQSSQVQSFSEKDDGSILPAIDGIIQSTFFEKPDIEVGDDEEEPEQARVTDLTLLGTLTGPRSFARAMIKKKGTNTAEIFKTGKEAYGYTIVKINETTVILKSGETTSILDMYPPDKEEQKASAPSNSSSSGEKVTKTISRPSLIQDLGNNMDNMLRGIRAGPYREDGNVVGYKLKTVSSQNILYKFGLRSGDILRRINGHPITSTQKLFELWQTFPKESRVIIDIQRNKEFKTFDFTIKD